MFQNVDGIDYPVVDKVEIAWVGWEMDNDLWLVRDPNTGGLKYLATNHGGYEFVSHEWVQDILNQAEERVYDLHRLMVKKADD